MKGQHLAWVHGMGYMVHGMGCRGACAEFVDQFSVGVLQGFSDVMNLIPTDQCDASVMQADK